MGLTLGLVGKPNVGKSTFFSAATAAKAEVANYPFTTIEPNRGVTYVQSPCPHTVLGVTCTPKNSKCENGIRFVPLELVDVAGLVPDAHKGKGLGNRFLDDLRQASALIHVIDLSGSTDAEGNPVGVGNHDPVSDIAFLENELDHWIAGILADKWDRTAKSIQSLGGGKVHVALTERLTGLGVREAHVLAGLNETKLDRDKVLSWTEDDLVRLAGAIRRRSKPILIAGNKFDQAPAALVEKVRAACAERGLTFVPCSAESELALRNAARAGVVDYLPGAETFEVKSPEKLTEKQRAALEYIRTHVMTPLTGSGVATVVRTAAYELLNLITAYPVEDEGKYTDKEGRVLPDAFLVPRGMTAKEFAYKVHSDLGDHFIRAIDAKKHRVVGADHEIADGDVIRIVADA